MTDISKYKRQKFVIFIFYFSLLSSHLMASHRGDNNPLKREEANPPINDKVQSGTGKPPDKEIEIENNINSHQASPNTPETSFQQEQSVRKKLDKPGFISDLLWGKIPEDVQEMAGGKIRVAYFKWPVKGGRFGRGFGSGQNGKHKALDIVAPAGTPVLAAARGMVVWADEKNGYGKTIIILHPGGWVTLYAHLSNYSVKKGQLVKARQKIGEVGNTGISRGPHLHFMFFDNGVLRDPAPLMHPSIPHLPHVPPMPLQGHTVKKGQTPLRIAEIYGVDVAELLEVNGMKEGEIFKPGWRIIIPKAMKSKSFERGYYIVKKGDTLSSIAVLYDVSVKELIALNDIDSGMTLRPGKKIKLPEGVFDGKAVNSSKAKEEKSSLLTEYTIKKGDSLFKIAKNYNTSISKIVALNNFNDSLIKLKPGMKIQIPSKPSAGNKNSAIGQKTKGNQNKKNSALNQEPPSSIKDNGTGAVKFDPVTEDDLDIEKVEDFQNGETIGSNK